MNRFENLLIEYREELQELKQTVINYQYIIENTNDIISIFDKNLNLIYINDIQQKISGFSKEEIMGKKAMDFIHPEDISRSINLFQKAKESGEGFGGFRLRCKDGSYVWLEVNAKIVHNKKGEPNAILVSRDITNRKLIEEKLKESEEKYKIITEHANDLICIIDEKFKFDYINENVHERLLGYRNKDLIGKHVGLFIHPDDLEFSIESFRDAIQKGESKGEIRFQNKQGNYIWIDFKGEHFFDHDGKRKHFLISRDITERKMVMQQLKDSEEKFRILYEKTYLGILLITKEGVILDCNRSFEKIFGFAKEEIVGKKYKDIGMVPEKTMPILLYRLNRVSKGKKIPTIEFKVKKKNGEKIWVRIKSSLVDVGVNSYIQIIGEDITELKNAENLVKKEIKKLKELDQVKTDLITRISHEIKTPLSLICGATEFLSEYYKEFQNDKVNEILEILKRGGHRLILLVKNLIDASKLDYSNIQLKVQKENISEIIRYCINEIKFFAEKRNHVISFDFDEDIFLSVNRERIEQVIMNILVNAVKNTPPFGKIYINIKKDNEYVEISIRDTGVGLTEEEKPRLFKKFGKIERYGKGLDVDTEGSGLGLYISKKVVELHGGKLWAESEGRNKGACFIIRLPVIA
ncbi:MAG: PAS domain-containing sensor histidine kinase [Promethearchaeota archaeon]|nr:MAG: PAS domain-containing sensor histidine kinase [Candidatus Lokiarchaeota archaeon]